MAKLTGPLLSINAGGQIGKTIVAFNWRGVKAARSYVVPANPQSASQTKTRSVFAWLSSVWKVLGADAQAAWSLYAQGQAFYNRNAFIGQNTKLLRAGTDLTTMLLSPGAKGGIPADAISATDGGTQEIDVTLTAPTLPDGWAIAKGIAVAIVSGDPHNGISAESYIGSAATTPWNPTITAVAGTFDVFGFYEFTKSDGTSAYGISKHTTVTVA